MKTTLAIFRLSFLVALFVGIGGLTHLLPLSPTLLDIHIVSGLIMLVSALWLAVETKSVVIIIAVLLIIGGGLVSIMSKADPFAVQVFHMAILIVAYLLAEVGVRESLRTQLHP